jgi:DNA-binding MarR family transcriptional regulator
MKMPKEQKKHNYVAPEEGRRLWVLLSEVGKGLRMALERELKPFGISPMQVGVMYCLDVMNDAGVSATPSEISRWLSRRPNTISALLQRMEKQGLVRLKRTGQGKGPILVERTAKGKKIYSKAEKGSSAIGTVLGCLSSDQRNQLRRNLEKLDQQIQELLTKKVTFPRL